MERSNIDHLTQCDRKKLLKRFSLALRFTWRSDGQQTKEPTTYNHNHAIHYASFTWHILAFSLSNLFFVKHLCTTHDSLLIIIIFPSMAGNLLLLRTIEPFVFVCLYSSLLDDVKCPIHCCCRRPSSAHFQSTFFLFLCCCVKHRDAAFWNRSAFCCTLAYYLMRFFHSLCLVCLYYGFLNIALHECTLHLLRMYRASSVGSPSICSEPFDVHSWIFLLFFLLPFGFCGLCCGIFAFPSNIVAYASNQHKICALFIIMYWYFNAMQKSLISIYGRARAERKSFS